jgi:hypothetical protein
MMDGAMQVGGPGTEDITWLNGRQWSDRRIREWIKYRTGREDPDNDVERLADEPVAVKLN